MNATSVPIAAASQQSHDAFSEEGISVARFEEILNDSYSVKNRQGDKISGDNKLGHTLVLRDGHVFCGACETKVAHDSGGVAKHIVGKKHRGRVRRHLQAQARAQANQDEDSVEGDSLAGERAMPMQTENSNPNIDSMQDASDGGKKSATSNEKTPTETADGDGDSENALPVQDLVVNGFDVVRYIRVLEGRISELEAMLAAANAVPSTENDAMA